MSGRGVKLATTENKSSWRVSAGLDFKFQGSKRTATLRPHFLKPVSFSLPRAHSFTVLLYI